MVASIPLTGLAANDPVPGNYIEILFAQGAAGLGTATYPALLIGNKTSAGAGAVNTVYGPTTATPCVTESDVIALTGTGSELHRMWLRFNAVNAVTPVYIIIVTASGGASATFDLTLATTAATNGNLRIWVGDEFVDTAITSGDTVGTISAAAVVNINAKTKWAVTAAQATVSTSNDTVRLTAKVAGPRGNWLRGQAVISGTGIGTTVTHNTPAVFANGTTPDSNTTALSTIIASRYYYIVSAAEDAAQFGALASQIDTQAAPTTGIRQRCFAGSVDASGSVLPIAQGRNNARAEVIWSQNSDWTPAELAANAAAIYALEEAPLNFRCNFSGYGNDAATAPYWKVPAPRTGTVPTRLTIQTLLNNGVTPIGVNSNGSTYLVKRVTTRSTTGGQPDYGIRDAHKVTVCDRYADDLVNKFTSQLAGKKLADDPVGNAPAPDPSVATPRIIKAMIDKLTDDYSDLALVQRAATIKANTVVIRESSPTTRVSARIPLQTIDILDQTGTQIQQVA